MPLLTIPSRCPPPAAWALFVFQPSPSFFLSVEPATPASLLALGPKFQSSRQLSMRRDRRPSRQRDTGETRRWLCSAGAHLGIMKRGTLAARSKWHTFSRIPTGERTTLVS